MPKVKISKGFKNMLFLASLTGILIPLLQFADIINLSAQALWIISLFYGIGLFIEGGGFLFVKMLKNGLTNKEIAHLVTLFTGLFIAGFSIYGLITGSIPEQTKGFFIVGYLVALVMTIIERRI